ncbi:MAG: hypothetical protein CMP53_00070 [Flavobacteriales bacterium]|nr:hypothetical protein [Flavobacteriales bacterium]
MTLLNSFNNKRLSKGPFLLVLVFMLNLFSTNGAASIESNSEYFVSIKSEIDNKNNSKKKKKKKSNKSNKSNNASAVSSNLIFAPNSIKAGSSGSCLIHLNNPTDDTLHFVIFPDMPFGWKLVNNNDVTIVLPNSKKTVALMLVPSNLSKVGLQRISFDFVDAENDIIIEEEVMIDIKENRRITLREVLGNRNLRKGGNGLPLKYRVYNAGNVPEIYWVKTEKKKTVYTIYPGDTIYHDVKVQLPARTNLKNYYDVFEIQILKEVDAEFVEEKSQRLTTSITLLSSGVSKPVSRFSIPLTTSTGLAILNNSANTNYSFTESINLAVPNKKQTQLTKVNLQLFSNNGGTSNQTRLDGNVVFIKKNRKSTLTATAGAGSSRGYFFFRIPNGMFSSGLELSGKDYSASGNISQKLPQFAAQDSIQGLRQLFLSRKLSERFNFSTHHFLADYTNDGSDFTNVSSLNYVTKKVRIENSIITHKEASEVFRPSQLALNNKIQVRTKNNSIRITSFLSGENFNRGSENMRFIEYDLSKTINNFSFRLSQELFNQSPLFTQVSNIARDQLNLSSNYNRDKFKGNVSMNRFTLANTIGLKENKTMNESYKGDLSYLLGKGSQVSMNIMTSNQETSINNSIDAVVSSRLIGLQYSSPMLNRNSITIGANSLNTNQQEIINTQGIIKRKINRKSTISLEANYRYNTNNPALDILQTKAEFSYRFNRTSVKLGTNISRLGNGLINANGLVNLTKTFAIARRDTLNFKQLDGIILDDSGNPISNVVMTINNHLIITDDQGEFYVHDIVENKVIIEIEKSTLPFGVNTYEGNSIEVLLLKEKNKIRIKTYKSAEIVGSSNIERTGLFRGALPIYANYYAVLTSLEDAEERHYTQLDDSGNFKLSGIDPGKWNLSVTCAAKSNGGWLLKQNNFELEIKSGNIIKQELLFSDKAPNLKIQKGLYVPNN